MKEQRSCMTELAESSPGKGHPDNEGKRALSHRRRKNPSVGDEGRNTPVKQEKGAEERVAYYYTHVPLKKEGGRMIKESERPVYREGPFQKSTSPGQQEEPVLHRWMGGKSRKRKKKPSLQKKKRVRKDICYFLFGSKKGSHIRPRGGEGKTALKALREKDARTNTIQVCGSQKRKLDARKLQGAKPRSKVAA